MPKGGKRVSPRLLKQQQAKARAAVLLSTPKGKLAMKLALKTQKQLKASQKLPKKTARALFPSPAQGAAIIDVDAAAPTTVVSAPPGVTQVAPSALVAVTGASTTPSYLSLMNGTATAPHCVEPSMYATVAHQTQVTNTHLFTVLARPTTGRLIQLVDGPHAKSLCACLRALGSGTPKAFFDRPVITRWFHKWTFFEAHLAGMNGMIKDQMLALFAHAPNWTPAHLIGLETLADETNKVFIIAAGWAYTHDVLQADVGPVDQTVMEKDFSDFVTAAQNSLLGNPLRQAYGVTVASINKIAPPKSAAATATKKTEAPPATQRLQKRQAFQQQRDAQGVPPAPRAKKGGKKAHSPGKRRKWAAQKVAAKNNFSCYTGRQ